MFQLPRIRSLDARRYATHPGTVVTSILVGTALGWSAPDFRRRLDAVGSAYIGLLSAIVLPFMLSAIVVSVQRFVREPGAALLLVRTTCVIGAVTMCAGL